MHHQPTRKGTFSTQKKPKNFDTKSPVSYLVYGRFWRAGGENIEIEELFLSCSGPPSISPSVWLRAEISDSWIYSFCVFLCFHFCVGFFFHKAPLAFVYPTLWILGLALQITNEFDEPKGSFGLISAISTLVAQKKKNVPDKYLLNILEPWTLGLIIGCHMAWSWQITWKYLFNIIKSRTLGLIIG